MSVSPSTQQVQMDNSFKLLSLFLRNIFVFNPVEKWMFVCCHLILLPVCLSVQLPGDLNKMHLTEHAHQQVMHVPPSQSGCSIASDSGSSSLSDIYQVSASKTYVKTFLR